MTRYHRITNMSFEGKLMVLIIDGEEKRLPIAEISSVLAKATEKERNTFEITPSGYGIHWPLLDEDLSVDGLLGIVHSPDVQKKSA